MACQAFLGRVLWHLGYRDQALTCGHRAIAIAKDVSHPFSQCWALSWAALHQLRHEVEQAQDLSEADLALATEQAIPFFVAHGAVLRGWTLVERGRQEEGIAQLPGGIAAYRAHWAEIERPHWLGLLAEAYTRRARQRRPSAYSAKRWTKLPKQASVPTMRSSIGSKGKRCSGSASPMSE
jgi:hypothetical protein